jgi:ribose-phosphate pyrophosphokinase
MSLLYALPGNEDFTDALCRHTGWRRGELELHGFPDGESLLRLVSPPQGAVALVCTLDRPDAKLFPLVLAAATARDLGASRVGLVAPYLAYMRQDARFRPGEAMSAHVLGGLLGASFDWIATTDPHLHRIRDLGEVFACRTCVAHAAPDLAEWIVRNVPLPLLIGPDGESAQWVRAVACRIGAPCAVAHKERHGDREVSVQLPSLEAWPGHTPVLLDDMASSGCTLLDALDQVRRVLPRAEAIGVVVHGLLTGDAWERLHAAGMSRLVSTNTVPGRFAAIDVSARLAELVLACGNP